MFFKLCKWYQIVQRTTFKISIWNSKFFQNKFPCHKSARKTKDMHTASNLNPETYSEPSQTSKMEYFCENHYRLKALNYFSKKLHLRFLTGFWTCLWNSAETKLIGVRWTNASFTLFLRNIMKIHSMILSLFRIL